VQIGTENVTIMHNYWASDTDYVLISATWRLLLQVKRDWSSLRQMQTRSLQFYAREP